MLQRRRGRPCCMHVQVRQMGAGSARALLCCWGVERLRQSAASVGRYTCAGHWPAPCADACAGTTPPSAARPGTACALRHTHTYTHALWRSDGAPATVAVAFSTTTHTSFTSIPCPRMDLQCQRAERRRCCPLVFSSGPGVTPGWPSHASARWAACILLAPLACPAAARPGGAPKTALSLAFPKSCLRR